MIEAPSRLGPDSHAPQPVSHQVRDFLREQGLVAGSPNGRVESTIWEDVVSREWNTWGILLPVERRARRVLGMNLGTVQPKRPLIGQVKLKPMNSELEGLPQGTQWAVKVLSKEHLERMEQLAKDLSQRFDKKVGVSVRRSS